MILLVVYMFFLETLPHSIFLASSHTISLLFSSCLALLLTMTHSSLMIITLRCVCVCVFTCCWLYCCQTEVHCFVSFRLEWPAIIISDRYHTGFPPVQLHVFRRKVTIWLYWSSCWLDWKYCSERERERGGAEREREFLNFENLFICQNGHFQTQYYCILNK